MIIKELNQETLDYARSLHKPDMDQYEFTYVLGKDGFHVCMSSYIVMVLRHEGLFEGIPSNRGWHKKYEGGLNGSE